MKQKDRVLLGIPIVGIVGLQTASRDWHLKRGGEYRRLFLINVITFNIYCTQMLTAGHKDVLCSGEN